jgi:hypothetical protein
MWITQLGRLMWWITTRIFAPFIAFALPIMILYGWLAPIREDFVALSLRKHEVAILVGAGAGGTTCSASRDCQSVPSQRSYIVIPRVFTDAAVVSVLRTTPIFTTQSTSGGALVLLLMWAACMYCTRRVYWRPNGLASGNRLEGSRSNT